MLRVRSFPPIENAGARVLILGSMPGGASLAAGQYYAHPRNLFWPIMGALLGAGPGLSYAARIRLLKVNGIALWDVVADASRSGSLDNAIRDPRANPVADFIATHPNLQAVAFNGRTAAILGRRTLVGASGPSLIDLPSSSAAFTRPMAEKSLDWAVLGGFAAPLISATVVR